MFKAAAAAGGERRAAGAETEPGLGLRGRRGWSEEAPPQAAPPRPALPVSPSSPLQTRAPGQDLPLPGADLPALSREPGSPPPGPRVSGSD